jgi:C_GCAxxG_C_C family probable redox protein
MGEVCGAVSGACMVLGLAYGNTRAEDKAGKERAYQAARQFAEQFRLRHDTILCRQLVGMDISTPAAVQAAREQGLLNHCPQFVHDASQILSTMLDEGTPS